MNIARVDRDGCTVFRLNGPVELYVTDRLRSQLLEAIDGEDLGRVVFNFHGVKSIDSAGLGLFIYLQFRRRDRTLFRFCHVNESVRRVFENTRLITAFYVDETEEESVLSFEGSP